MPYIFYYQQASRGAEAKQEVTYTFDNGQLTGSNGETSTTVEAHGNHFLPF